MFDASRITDIVSFESEGSIWEDTGGKGDNGGSGWWWCCFAYTLEQLVHRF